MITEPEARYAAATGRLLRDHDGEIGRATEFATDGETYAVRLVGENFERWADTLDLDYAATVEDAWREAEREEWARVQVAAAGKSWDTHMTKFGGAVVEREA